MQILIISQRASRRFFYGTRILREKTLSIEIINTSPKGSGLEGRRMPGENIIFSVRTEYGLDPFKILQVIVEFIQRINGYFTFDHIEYGIFRQYWHLKEK